MTTLTLYLTAGRATHPAADWAIDLVLFLGPGVAFCSVLYGLYSTSLAIHERLAARRELRHIENYANHPGARRHHTRTEDQP